MRSTHVAKQYRGCAMERVNFINCRTALAQITGTGVCSVAETMVQFVLEIKAWTVMLHHLFPGHSQTIPRPLPQLSQIIP